MLILASLFAFFGSAHPQDGRLSESVVADLHKFKNRELKAKAVFTLRPLSKKEAWAFVTQYHYLGDAAFFASYSYGLYPVSDGALLGVASFTNPQGNVALKGWFGLANTDKTVLELSRLCVHPLLNGTNATSFLLSGSIKMVQKEGVRAVITLADDCRHSGSIYQVCNFTYFGLSDSKTDFFTPDGRVNPRGPTTHTHGAWLPRTRKHRYAYIVDESLKCNYPTQERPSKEQRGTYDCCGGSLRVFDKRFSMHYSCPKCTGALTPLAAPSIQPTVESSTL